MKKCISFLLVCILLVSLFPVPVRAVSAQPEFRFELTVDGSEVKEVHTGEIITVTLHLQRTDSDEAYTMYGMQSEIRYDSSFFELVENSAILSNGIQSTDIGRPGGFREFYMNFVSLSGGAKWQSTTRVGSFQLRVIGTEGVSTITNEDYLVSFQDGSGSYPCEANTLTVVLTTDCTVRFETNGGSKIEPVSAVFGELLTRPADPVREGKQFAGWYKDIHLTKEWNFDTDTVTGNMTLYAKWENAPAEPTDPTEPEPTNPEPTEPEPTDPPHVHTWQPATCTTPKTCTTCHQTEGTALGHKEVIDKAVAATCTSTGKTEGKHCDLCGIVLVAQKDTAKLDHTETKMPGKPATCTEEGLTDGSKCSVCGIILIAQKGIPKLSHRFHDGKCTVCGMADPDYVPPTEPEPTEPENPTEPEEPEVGVVKRIAGENRYQTSFAIANELKDVLGIDKFRNVILANSDVFADALAGSYLAAEKNAPILIGKPKYAQLVWDYVNNNLEEGGTVYVLGGVNAVPESMLDGITVTDNIIRLEGEDRYGTNLEILDYLPVGNRDILVATGRDFADSLSASATGLPILLVNGKAGKSLSAEQKDFLANVTGKIYILGGENAVPADLEAEINKASGQTAARISGASRYVTSVNLAATFLPDAKSAVTAYASTFPDGLCGGPLAYAKGAPLLLTKDGKAEAPTYAESKNITSGYVLGGDSLISDAFAKDIFNVSEILK